MSENKHFFQKTWAVALLALLCCVLWGSATPCIKIGYKIFNIEGDTSGQILFAGMRFILAGVLTVLIGSVIAKKPLIPKKTSVKYILALSMVQTVIQYIFFYMGHANAKGVSAAIVNGSNVFIAILVAVFVFRTEKMTLRKMAGCIVGFAGVITVSLSGGAVGFSLTGEGFVLIAALAYAFSTVMLKLYSKYENPVVLSGWQFFAGGIIMTAAALAFGGRVSINSFGGYLLLIYMACISAVAYSVWGLLMKYNDVSRVSMYGPFNPISGTLLSAVFLKEANVLGPQVIAALVLVSAGILIVNYNKN